MTVINEPGVCSVVPDTVLGIDFGTTNSLIAYSANGRDVELFNVEGSSSLLRSVVLYKGEDVQVGSVSDPELALYDVKRGISQGDYDSVIDASEIFKKLKKIAEDKIDRGVKYAVVSVPAYFDGVARLAVMRAAQLAGLNVIRLINEPTAAAIAYGFSSLSNNAVYVVYDLGGGTFDISVLKTIEGVFKVIANGGDLYLGGNDFTENLLSIVLKKSNYEISDFSAELKRKLLLIAESVKLQLSHSDMALFEFTEGDISISCKVTLSEFEEAIYPVVKKTLDITDKVLAEADNPNFKTLVVVGGASYTPLVKKMSESKFGKDKVLVSKEPEEIVVKGSAIQAYGLSKKGREENCRAGLLVDVLPLSLGLETYGGLMEKIISKNAPLPALSNQSFTTGFTNQKSIKIHVCQGENEMVSRNRSLAVFEFGGITPGPKGAAKIDVEFRVDVDGLLTVTVTDSATDHSDKIELMQNFGLDENTVRREIESSINAFTRDFAESSLQKKKFLCNKLLSIVKLVCLNKNVPKADTASISAMANSLVKVLECEDLIEISREANRLEALLNNILLVRD